MKLGVSPITNTIYAGNTKINKKGFEEWTKKEDVTDNAVKAVFEWFMNNSNGNNGNPFVVSIKGHGTLTYDPNGVLESEDNS